MPKNLILEPKTRKKIDQIGRVDILVGIPSFNNVRTIAHVVRAISAGLAKYFPQAKALVVNSDGGSTDGTREAVLSVQAEDMETMLVAHPVYPVHKIVTPYHGLPGKGSAFRTIFKIADELEAKACLVVDADLRSITPEWVQLLVMPVLNKGYDYVCPLYSRHKYDGTITNSIVYPMTRALYGLRIRQPIGGDFGISGKLVKIFLNQDVWDTEVARYGIDIWMTTTAITQGCKICQSYLGAKIHDAKDPATHLSTMLCQVLCSLFGLMVQNHNFWANINSSREVPVFGFRYEVGLDPVFVDLARMVANFKQGLSDLLPIWEKVLSARTMQGLLAVNNFQPEEFSFPAELWVQVVYDFALAYRRCVINQEHLVKSLTPLYLARTAAFMNETANSSASEVEQRMETVCQQFEALKGYLLSSWG